MFNRHRMLILIVLLCLSLSSESAGSIIINIDPNNSVGRVCLPGFSNGGDYIECNGQQINATGMTQTEHLKSFFEDYHSLRGKSAFGKFHRVPVQRDFSNEVINMSNVIEYDKKIGREPILLIEMDSIKSEDIQTIFTTYPAYRECEWYEIGNEVWHYIINGNCRYSFDYGTQGAMNYASDLISYIQEIRKMNPKAKIMICSAEGNYLYWSNQKWTQNILEVLHANQIKIDALAFHIYSEYNYYSPLSIDRYFAIPYCAANNWVTYMSKNVYMKNAIGVPDLLRHAIMESHYDLGYLRLFCTEYSILAGNPNCYVPDRYRSGMINALIYAGLIVTMSDEDVDSVLMHQLGRYCVNGWSVFNSKHIMRPFGYAVKMLSELQKNRIPVEQINDPRYSVSGDALTLTTGAIPTMSDLPYIYTLASKDNNGDKLSIAIINFSASEVATITISNAENYKEISLSQMSADKYDSSNEETEDLKPIQIPISMADLENFPVPEYSISLLTLSTFKNNPPMANAGPDRIVHSGDVLILDGSGSIDSDGTIVSYEWTQTKGSPNIELIDKDSIQASYRVPAIFNDTKLTFQLTILDNCGLASTDDVVITINGGSSGYSGGCFIDNILK